MSRHILSLLSLTVILFAWKAYFPEVQLYAHTVSKDNVQVQTDDLPMLRQNALLSTTPPVLYEPVRSSVWQKLMAVCYEENGDWRRPRFSEMQKEYKNQTIGLKGYIIKVKNTSFFLLSYYPANTCFFNTKVSPASLVIIKTTEDIAQLNTDKPVLFRGTLRLNEENPSKLFYTLEDAKIVK